MNGRQTMSPRRGTSPAQRAACERQVRDPLALDPHSDDGRRFFQHAAECPYCGGRVIDARMARVAIEPLVAVQLPPARVARLQERVFDALDGGARGRMPAVWPKWIARLLPLVACGAVGFWLATLRGSKDAPVPEIAHSGVVRPAGEPVEAAERTRALKLPDGSVALLSRGSTALGATTTQPLRLARGRALLVVRPRKNGNRFEVVTPEARVTVLGTVFSVERQGEVTHVEVHEGRVWVSAPAGTDGRVLGPGERVALVGSGKIRDDGRASTLQGEALAEIRKAAEGEESELIERATARGLTEHVEPPAEKVVPEDLVEREPRVRKARGPAPYDGEAALRAADLARKGGDVAGAIRRYRAVVKQGAEPWAKFARSALADVARHHAGAGLDERAQLEDLAERYPEDNIGKLARERLDALRR